MVRYFLFPESVKVIPGKRVMSPTGGTYLTSERIVLLAHGSPFFLFHWSRNLAEDLEKYGIIRRSPHALEEANGRYEFLFPASGWRRLFPWMQGWRPTAFRLELLRSEQGFLVKIVGLDADDDQRILGALLSWSNRFGIELVW